MIIQSSAIQMNTYGPPEVLRFEHVDMVPLRPDEVRIKTIAAAVNHTDLEIRAGNWPIRKSLPFPYVPGVEVVGEVVEIGSAVLGVDVGAQAITMMQGLGGVRADRPGGYSEFVTVGEQALATLPPEIDPMAMAAIGLGGVTAHEGLRRIGPIGGRRVVVTGAAGGVGSSAVALARAQGAWVIGIVSRSEQIPYVTSAGAREVYIAGEQPGLAPASVDGVFDTVGASLFPTCLAALKPGGTYSIVGAVSGSEIAFDLWELIRPVTLTGYSSETLDGPSFRQAIATLGRLIASGSIKAPA
jgi:NADPH2:quinone reductase